MNLNAKLKLALLALLSGASIAQAEVRIFKISGTVVQSTPTAPAGSKVIGTFSYDTSAQPSYTIGDSSGRTYGHSNYSVPAKFELKVNAHTISSESFYVDVVNNFGGNVEDSVTVYSSPMTMNGTYLSEGSFGFTLATGPGKKHVLRSTELPNRLPVKRYDATLNYGWVTADGSGNGTLLSFSIDRIKLLQEAGDADE